MIQAKQQRVADEWQTLLHFSGTYSLKNNGENHFDSIHCTIILNSRATKLWDIFFYYFANNNSPKLHEMNVSNSLEANQKITSSVAKQVVFW